MTNIKTYDPIFGSVADFVGSKWFNFAGNQPDAFPMDIIERSDEYEIRVVVPGANKDGLAVEVEGDVLHINVVGNNIILKIQNIFIKDYDPLHISDK